MGAGALCRVQPQVKLSAPEEAGDRCSAVVFKSPFLTDLDEEKRHRDHAGEADKTENRATTKTRRQPLCIKSSVEEHVRKMFEI